MNRFYATALLVIYSMFSCLAVGSTHIYAGGASEGTEKEVVIGSFPEHREERSVRLATNIPSFSFKNTTAYHHFNEKPRTSLLSGFSVPFYILHCVYRR